MLCFPVVTPQILSTTIYYTCKLKKISHWTVVHLFTLLSN